MNASLSRSKPVWLLTAIAVALTATVGCGSPDAEFRANHVYLAVLENQNNLEIERRQMQNVKDVVTALFGTPDEPKVPQVADVDFSQVMDQRMLEIAAGPVKRINVDAPQGLYREHCAHCHGVTGDGAGPTAAFLNPYPRDYRRGMYKFKSTPIGAKPTDEDLHRTLYEGIQGTSMPSFKLLPKNERESLVHYVRYLSIRGEVERNLIYALITDLDEGDLLVDLGKDDNEQLDYVREIVADVTNRWIEAEEKATPVPPRPDVPMEESIAKGRDLFFGKVANCVKCHGPTAIGDGVLNDYDVWSKELGPDKPEDLDDLLALGALKPRTIRPRNLRMNEFRGGRRPIDLFWRIHNGIEGTPMPAASLRPEGAPPSTAGLTTDDIWHLVDYVRSLPHDALSRPGDILPLNERRRN